MEKCPYISRYYECDDCRYCKTEPYKKGGLDNWNMLDRIVKVSNNGIEDVGNIGDFIDDFDRDFLGTDENGILSDERMFEDGLDGGYFPTTESLTRDFNRIFGANLKSIFED